MSKETTNRMRNFEDPLLDMNPFTIAAQHYHENPDKTQEYYISITTDTPSAEVHQEGISLYFQTYNNFDQPVRNVLRCVKGRVIDIGCGPGRFALYLQTAGYDVTGLDRSAGLLNICSQKGLTKVIEADIMELVSTNDKVGIYDTVLILGRNIGIAGNEQNVATMLQYFHKTTTKNARIVIDSLDVEKAAKTNRIIREDLIHSESLGRSSNQIAFKLSYDHYQSDWFDWIHLSPLQLEHLSQKTGWKLTKIFSGTNGYWAGCMEKRI